MRPSFVLSALAVFAALLIFYEHKAGVHHSHTDMRSSSTSITSSADTLTIAQSADMESMEPDSLNSLSSVNIADLLWGRLLNITPEGVIVPSMASGYSWNAAGTEITFNIKPGLVCEDGEPLTAEDVVYTFNRAADPKLGSGEAARGRSIVLHRQRWGHVERHLRPVALFHQDRWHR